MNKGKWLAMDKNLVTALPTIRRYTIVEAAYSYQMDKDNGTLKSMRSYSRIWGWSMNRVKNFIKLNRVSNDDRGRHGNTTIEFRWIEALSESEKQLRNTKGTRKRRRGDTTNNTDTEPNTKKKSIYLRGGKYDRKHKGSDIEQGNDYDRGTEVFTVS